MLLFVGFNRQGLISFYSVLCASIFTPYLVEHYAPTDFSKALIISFVGPLIVSFVLIHLVENRKKIAGILYDKIIGMFSGKKKD